MEFESIYRKISANVSLPGKYYLVSYRPFDDQLSYVSIFTHFKKWYETPIEVRVASAILAPSAMTHFEVMELPLSVVSSIADFYKFLRLGGHAIINESVMKTHWPELLQEIVTVKTFAQGFIAYNSLSMAKNRIARGKLRMKIFTRDGYRCRLCGSSTDDNAHVKLEVHHIMPWEEKGLTQEENLITLCKACHDEAKQIDRDHLYGKIGIAFPTAKYKLIDIDSMSTTDQRMSFLYIANNTVTLEIKAKGNKRQ